MEKLVLDNGLRVLLLPLPGAHSASVDVWVEAGSRFEEPAEQGISHFVEHMLFKGTTSRSSRVLSEEMDRLGGSMNAYTTQECTRYYAQVLAENAAETLDILSDMLLHARLTPEDTALERQVILDEIAMYEDIGEDLAHEALCAAVWAGSPLGRPICGTRETVAAIDAPALRRYIAAAYTPERMLAVIAGAFDRQAVLACLHAGLGSLPWGGGRPAADAPAFHPGLALRPKDFEQSCLELGFPGLAAGDPRRYAMMLLNYIVGGGVSSRLFQRLREELGLAYAVYSANSAETGAGLFTISASVSPDKQETALREIRGVLTGLLDGVTDAEFQRARAQAKSAFILGMETVAARAGYAGRNERVFGREISASAVIAALDGVEKREVDALARTLFAGTPVALAVAGPVGAESLYAPYLAPLGRPA